MIAQGVAAMVCAAAAAFNVAAYVVGHHWWSLAAAIFSAFMFVLALALIRSPR